MDDRKLYNIWCENAKEDNDLIEELKSIENNDNEIYDRFYTALKFGTAGLRGVIGAGTNRMNIYVVRQATQGLANYVLNKYGKGKYLLRKAFEGDYLPDEILWREKAAFSDAVGHSMVDDLKAYAETVYTDEEFEAGRLKYEYAVPFTKESLLYRDIFEKYYPGQAEMIVDFWMPNREWEGCDVNDPSARVLSNYGDSGK